VNVHPGDSITGSVRLRYTTIGRGLLYVLAQTSTWREPREDTTTVRSLLAGVVDARLSVPLALRAPDREGDFWLQMLVFESTFLVLAFANALFYALTASRARHMMGSPRAIRWFNRSGAVLLIGAGLAAAALPQRG
jgi:hypothetical protein